MTKEVCTHDVKNSTKYKQSMIKNLKNKFYFYLPKFQTFRKIKINIFQEINF